MSFLAEGERQKLKHELKDTTCMHKPGLLPEARREPEEKDAYLASAGGVRKHKRAASPSFSSQAPAKVAKTSPGTGIDTHLVQVKRRLDKEMIRPDYGASGSHRSERRHAVTDHSPSKKVKLEEDTMRAENGGKKHVRKRMKSLLEAVLQQMEFYFGDSNLSKDRYLRKLIDNSSDGYIDLSVFGNFNKLQSLHKDGVSMKVLSAAVRKSDMLQLSDDGSKVRRTTPIKHPNQEETDSRTVYVEHLHAQANHAWIRSVFSQCGKVMYVSLPVYKTTKMIKGFAFVEFETPEEASRACMLLNNPLPSRLDRKPGKFPKGNKTLNRLQRLAPPQLPDKHTSDENIFDGQESDPMADSGSVSKKKKKKKRKIENSVEECDSKPSITLTEEIKEQVDGKKKKKKKWKRSNQPQDVICDEEETKKSVGDRSNVVENVCVCPPLTAQDVSSIAATATDTDADAASQEVGCQKHGHSHEGDLQDTNLAKKKKNKRRRKRGKKEECESKDKSDAECWLPKEKRDETGQTKLKLGRKQRKQLRQEDIRRKKMDREALTSAVVVSDSNTSQKISQGESSSTSADVGLYEESASTAEISETAHEASRDKKQCTSVVGATEGRETGGADSEASRDEKQHASVGTGMELTSILKCKKGPERKRVEFDPVPITTEFVKAREMRKRKKPKKEKLHLRVIPKKEWVALKAQYIAQQKSHMAALKESLRELRLQENQGNMPGSGNHHHQRVDLEDVFGTKRLKPSQDMKMAHVESLKFVANVIVQWKCSHEMSREKLRTMFKEVSGDSIAYIDSKEEAKFGYIRFKDEASAEEFTKLSRHSMSFMARILPADQQEEYWKKANDDRLKKLGRKHPEKGSQKIARKVFERNKVTFFHKPNHIVFHDDDDSNAQDSKQLVREEKRS